MPSATIWSSAEVTSSQMTSSGSAASARAMQIRCFWPPESSPGSRLGEAPVELDHVQELVDPPVARGTAKPAEALERPAQNVAHPAARVQRRVRRLVDHLEPAQQLLGPRLERRRQGLAAKADPAFARWQEPADHAGKRRFAGAGLADHRDRPPAGHLDANAVQRPERAVVGIDVIDAQQHVVARLLGLHERAHCPERLRIGLLRGGSAFPSSGPPRPASRSAAP